MAVNQYFLFKSGNFPGASYSIAAAADPEFSYTQLKPNDSEYLTVNRREKATVPRKRFSCPKSNTDYGQTL